MPVMKVCIPIETKSQGGGFYFIDNLRRYLEREGVGHTQNLTDGYDVMLLNSWHVTYYQVMRAWRANPEARLVHRVDGSAQDYGRDDDPARAARWDARQARVNRLADVTIFQSAYCRHSTREKFPVISQDGRVIWNAVDVDTFAPEGPRRDLPGRVKVCYVTFSTNPRKGAPELYRVATAHQEVDFILCGRYEAPPDLANLHLLGHLGREELAAVMRSCDVLLTFAQHEACPNVVLEALASGLPVLYLESGAASEVVGEAGLPVTVETFRAQLEAALAERAALSARARQRALTHFHPDRVFPRYVAAMQEALAAPPRVLPARRRALVRRARLTEPLERAWARSRPFRRRVRGKLRSLGR